MSSQDLLQFDDFEITETTNNSHQRNDSSNKISGETSPKVVRFQFPPEEIDLPSPKSPLTPQTFQAQQQNQPTIVSSQKESSINKSTLEWIKRLPSQTKKPLVSDEKGVDFKLAQLEKTIIQLQVLHKAALAQIANKNVPNDLFIQVRHMLFDALETFPPISLVSGNIFSMKSFEDIKNSSTYNSILQYLKRDFVLKEEGIFRLSGSKKVQNEWKEFITSKQSKPLIERDIHAIASLFKEWLREMPIPLLGGDDYNNWIEVGKRVLNPQDRMESIAKLLCRVKPLERRWILNDVLELMVLVSQYSSFNQMSSANLGIVFGINVIRQTGQPGSIVDGKITSKLWEHLIDHFYIYESILKSTYISEDPFEKPKPQLPTFHQETPVQRQSSSEQLTFERTSSSENFFNGSSNGPPPIPSKKTSQKIPPELPPKTKEPPPIPKK